MSYRFNPFTGQFDIDNVPEHELRYHSATAAAINHIGIAGGPGFGVGICPAVPSGFTPMAGFDQPLSDNYGNYQYSDGSVMCWIPAFFYRIASASSPRYAAYGANAVDILPRSAYTTVAEANAAGYALHRAFYDGTEQPGFFVDKYQWSAHVYGGNTIAGSIKYGNPLSCSASHNGWGSLLTGLTTGENNTGGAIPAAKTRGADFFPISHYQFGALALLALAHGQASTSTTYCAWWTSTGVSAPRGCSNSALSDVDDTSVVWQSDGYLNVGKTGSAGYGGGAGNTFSKSTHNGQNCGVADLNGNVWEVPIGMTCIAPAKNITAATKTNPVALTVPAHGRTTGDVILVASVGGMTSINNLLFTITVVDANTLALNGVDGTGFGTYTSGGTIKNGAFYAAKTTTRMKNFTNGNTLATDHWGATGVSAMMDPLPGAGFLRTDYPYNSLNRRFGKAAGQVLSAAVSGDGWVQTGLGLPLVSGISDNVSGSNLFGADYYYQNIWDEMCPMAGGSYNSSTSAGVFARYLTTNRTYADAALGSRSGYYL